MTEWLHFHFSLSRIGEGNGNPLQCSCLENPRDGWAAVYGVAQSRTGLTWLSSSSSSSSSSSILHYLLGNLKPSWSFRNAKCYILKVLYMLYELMLLCISESEIAQSCLALCDPMDCSLPGSSIHGISQARILEWVAISSSRGSSWPRD